MASESSEGRLDPKDFKVAGERSKGEDTITAYQNAFERFENWVFEVREAVDNEPLLDETVQVFEDGSCKLNWTAFLESLERRDNLYFRYMLQFQEKEHAKRRSAWAHIKTLRSALTYYIFQLK